MVWKAEPLQRYMNWENDHFLEVTKKQRRKTMHKALYADAVDYFEKMEKKHAYQANKAKWQGRSEQEIENIQRKKEYARLAVEALRQMEG